LRYSKRVALSGLVIGVAGVLQANEVVQLGAFMILAAAAVCRSIESKESE